MTTYRCYIPAYLPRMIEAKSKDKAIEECAYQMDSMPDEIEDWNIVAYKLPDIDNADHPARQKAIKIIEQVIEPLLKKGLKGSKYYQIEDKITHLIHEAVRHGN